MEPKEIVKALIARSKHILKLAYFTVGLTIFTFWLGAFASALNIRWHRWGWAAGYILLTLFVSNSLRASLDVLGMIKQQLAENKAELEGLEQEE